MTLDWFLSGPLQLTFEITTLNERALEDQFLSCPRYGGQLLVYTDYENYINQEIPHLFDFPEGH